MHTCIHTCIHTHGCHKNLTWTPLPSWSFWSESSSIVAMRSLAFQGSLQQWGSPPGWSPPGHDFVIWTAQLFVARNTYLFNIIIKKLVLIPDSDKEGIEAMATPDSLNQYNKLNADTDQGSRLLGPTAIRICDTKIRKRLIQWKIKNII